MPVATMETLNWPSIEPSNAEPKIMLALSSSTSSVIRCAALSTSNKVISLPPVIFTNMPFAVLILMSPSKGLCNASSAALMARSSPSACPLPIIALPMPFITLCTSAKSKLMRPGETMRSVTLRTPASSTSSARRNESARLVCWSTSWKMFWFGMTMSVSVTFSMYERPSSARRVRCLPSKRKGFVTTATVKMPASRHASAMIGAAPVPVPPPIPAVMKAM
mmetsp:Transcript_30480/g.62041  ORF Transcript_30480/g.62041 Transcript_30480/m.62041 type:complete len:221 (+) Transcript_30480:67-729(+)